VNTNPNPATTRARAVLGAALLSGGLALAALASATAHASPFDSGPLPEPNCPSCHSQGLTPVGYAPESLVVFDFNPFSSGPLPEPTGPEWGHQTHSHQQ
jgi:hypothetical protein